jgi:FkbM family methyltransferase
MNYDFIEIGTSMYDTLIERASDNTIGLTIEPIKKYLDMLPSKSNVKKVNTAITSNRQSNFVDIYYIPDNVIDSNGWPDWLKGCNSINTYHPNHLSESRMREVVIDKVPLLNIDELFEQYHVKSVNFLKIDTEGHDVVILNGLFTYLVNHSIEKYPKRIEFESNIWTPVTDVDNIILKAISIGYRVLSRGHDTILVLDTTNPSKLKINRINGRFKVTA